MWSLFLVFFFISFSKVEAELNATSALETTSVIGSNVTFKCQTTSRTERIRWLFMAPSVEHPVRIHNGYILLRQYENHMSENFDVISRESFLTINRADQNDSGIYRCLETNSTENWIDFKLDFNPVVVEQQAPATATSGTSHHHTANTQSQSLSPAEIVLTVALVSTAGIMACVFVVVLLSRQRKKHSSRQHYPVPQTASSSVPATLNSSDHETETNSGLDESRTPTVPPRAPVYRSNQELYVNTTGQQAAVNRDVPANIVDDDIDPMYAQVAGRRNDGQQLVAGRAQSRRNIDTFV